MKDPLKTIERMKKYLQKISLKKLNLITKQEKINEYSNFTASAVVTANAYGFGLLEEIALSVCQSGCSFSKVAQIEEAVKLRNCLKI